MVRKRSKIEIYLDVLRTVKSGTNRPTNIMYRCNLAWKPFKRILDSLTGNGLLEMVEKGNRRIYELTEKGHDVLRYFETAEAILATLRRPGETNSIASQRIRSSFRTRQAAGLARLRGDHPDD